MKQKLSIVATNHCGAEAEAAVRALQNGVDVMLVREPDNKFDKNAVAVCVGGRRIGYIPKNKNVPLAAHIDADGQDVELPGMAQDQSAPAARKAIGAKFVRSPNSGYPMVEMEIPA